MGKHLPTVKYVLLIDIYYIYNKLRQSGVLLLISRSNLHVNIIYTEEVISLSVTISLNSHIMVK